MLILGPRCVGIRTSQGVTHPADRPPMSPGLACRCSWPLPPELAQLRSGTAQGTSLAAADVNRGSTGPLPLCSEADCTALVQLRSPRFRPPPAAASARCRSSRLAFRCGSRRAPLAREADAVSKPRHRGGDKCAQPRKTAREQCPRAAGSEAAGVPWPPRGAHDADARPVPRFRAPCGGQVPS
jgi:hypothetical protein